MNAQELKELGLNTASDRLISQQEAKRKMVIAYEFYRFVTPEIFGRFQEALRKKTWDKKTYSYNTLVFIPLREYREIPPEEALQELKLAKSRNCFDEFEVGKIESVQEIPDPIIFGCIKGCADKFFICQWDNDVKIEDILKENEG